MTENFDTVQFLLSGPSGPGECLGEALSARVGYVFGQGLCFSHLDHWMSVTNPFESFQELLGRRMAAPYISMLTQVKVVGHTYGVVQSTLVVTQAARLSLGLISFTARARTARRATTGGEVISTGTGP